MFTTESKVGFLQKNINALCSTNIVTFDFPGKVLYELLQTSFLLGLFALFEVINKLYYMMTTIFYWFTLSFLCVLTLNVQATEISFQTSDREMSLQKKRLKKVNYFEGDNVKLE